MIKFLALENYKPRIQLQLSEEALIANKIYSTNVLLTFPLSYENIISECSLNI